MFLLQRDDLSHFDGCSFPEFDQIKTKLYKHHQGINNLEQYQFSGIPEPANEKEDTDQIPLNVINKYKRVGTGQQNMQMIAISKSHCLGPRPRPGTRDQETKRYHH